MGLEREIICLAESRIRESEGNKNYSTGDIYAIGIIDCPVWIMG
jgi:hypothetical protein